jgi:hypothetical protein
MFFRDKCQGACENKIARTRKSPGVCFTDINLESYSFTGKIISDFLKIVKFPLGGGAFQFFGELSNFPQVFRGRRMLEHGFRINRGSGALTKPAAGFAVPKL